MRAKLHPHQQRALVLTGSSTHVSRGRSRTRLHLHEWSFRWKRSLLTQVKFHVNTRDLPSTPGLSARVSGADHTSASARHSHECSFVHECKRPPLMERSSICASGSRMCPVCTNEAVGGCGCPFWDRATMVERLGAAALGRLDPSHSYAATKRS